MDESSIYKGGIQIQNLVAKYTHEEKTKAEKNPFLCCLFVNSQRVNTERDNPTLLKHHHSVATKEAMLHLYPC